MGQLNKLMRSKLRAFATEEKAKLEKALLWPFQDSKLGLEDDIITLGCFIPGAWAIPEVLCCYHGGFNLKIDLNLNRFNSVLTLYNRVGAVWHTSPSISVLDFG